MSSDVPKLPRSEIGVVKGEPQTVYAGFLRRVAALMLDGLLLMFPWGLFRYVVTGGANDFLIILIGIALEGVVCCIYYSALESSRWEGSLGKVLLGLRVTDVAGGRISFARASARTLWKIPSGLVFGIGFMMAGFTKRKQALHDVMAGCLVVRGTREPAPPR